MNTPATDLFYMPAEYSRHSGTIVIFPERAGSWIYGAKYVRPVFFELVNNICSAEKVYIAVSGNNFKVAEELFKNLIAQNKVELWKVKCDDCWARDIAPTFVTDGKTLRGVDWQFNAWGGQVDGLYKNWENDDKFAQFSCKKLSVSLYSARPFVLEGGSIHSNGADAVITTEECLLSAGRNPGLTKAQIEQKLKEFLGAKRVVWLPYGIMGDETNGHVDNICAFTAENEVVLGWTSRKGEQHRRCKENLKVLKSFGIKVRRLPFPKQNVEYTQFEADGLEYEEGEQERSVDERLAASYVNFYVCNAGVIVPVFGDKNDKKALKILQKAFKNKKIIPIYARQFILGGGNVHCLTQQIPEPVPIAKNKKQ